MTFILKAHTSRTSLNPSFTWHQLIYRILRPACWRLELISSWQRRGKLPQWKYYLCGSFSEFRNGAFVHEKRHEAEGEVGHIVHHRTYRWMEPVPCAFPLSVDQVCMHCFFYPGPHFLNISLLAASEMLKFRRLNLGRHLTSDSWPSEAHVWHSKIIIMN